LICSRKHETNALEEAADDLLALSCMHAALKTKKRKKNKKEAAGVLVALSYMRTRPLKNKLK
jgi:hypothetical protein